MGKQTKQGQTAQRQMSDYEKNRLLRIQENQARLRELGVKSMANSLLESQKTKKQKVKQTYTNEEDVDYIPELDDDSEKECQGVTTTGEVSKKHHPQYIAPMSMKRIVNISKQHLMEQMKNCKSVEDGSDPVDPFMIVMNKEHDGYRRLYGRGVTNKLIKKKNGGDTSYMIPGGLMESFKPSVEVEKNELIEIRKEIEEDHERKKAELEAMREDINNQRANLEALMQRFMVRLPPEDRN